MKKPSMNYNTTCMTAMVITLLILSVIYATVEPFEQFVDSIQIPSRIN